MRLVARTQTATDGTFRLRPSRIPKALSPGVVHVSERFTARDNSVRLPPYTRFDAGASYEIVGRKLLLSLAAQNLTDLRYVTSGAGRAFFAGPPRRLSATVTTSF